MFRFLFFFALIALADSARAADVVKITGHPNWPPFSWQDGDNIVGIGAELSEIVFKDVGLTVLAVPGGNWKRAQAQVEFGAIDVLMAACKTKERTACMADPATPFMEDVNVLWVARGREFAFRE
jgi:polar amino acid transport system substrate-binding protein